MALRRAGGWLACLIIAATVHAEDNCGDMVRRAIRFRGTVLSVEQLGERTLDVTPIDLNMEYAVSIRVDSVEPPPEGVAAPPLEAGDTRHFGVHSPSRTFGSELTGKTLDLQIEWMVCDKAFRRFSDIRVFPRTPFIEETDHWLEPGHTYRAEARWEDEGPKIVSPVSIPRHHGYGFHWTNAEDFPRSARDGEPHPIVFEVLSVGITHWPADHMWSSIYEVKLVSTR